MSLLSEIYASTQRVVLEQFHYSMPSEKVSIVDILHGLCIGKTSGMDWTISNAENTDPQIVVADKEYKVITIHTDEENAFNETSRFLLRTAFECRFCFEGIVSLHAACVENGEYAVAFTGQSGLGKSTRAKAWVDALGFEWISGDRPAVRLEKDGATACGVPWDGKEQICIMEVRRSPANEVRRLSADQARKLLMQQTFVPMWDTDAAVMAMANVRKLISKVPVYRVFCGPTAEDAQAIYDILVHHPEQIREEREQMKIKNGFVLRNVVDEYIVMPTGDNIAKFDGAVVLNEVSAFIFKLLENPVSREDLLAAMLAEYEVEEATAAADLDALLEKFETMGVLEK